MIKPSVPLRPMLSSLPMDETNMAKMELELIIVT